MNERCKHVEKDGFHRCGSYAFNLYKDDIDQGELCDVHYWQERALEAEALAKEKALQALHSENERLGLYKDAYQPEQEPVAWARYPRYTGKAQLSEIVFKKPEGKDWLELYAHPPQREKANG